MLLECLWLAFEQLLYELPQRLPEYKLHRKRNTLMTKNRTSAICCPSLEEMPLIHNFPLLWHHGVLLNSELWIVWKELYSFIKRRPAFHCICQALCWVCSFFFSDRGAGCKILWQLAVRLCHGCVGTAWSELCWDCVWWGQPDNGGFTFQLSLLHLSPCVNFLGVQDLNN